MWGSFETNTLSLFKRIAKKLVLLTPWWTIGKRRTKETRRKEENKLPRPLDRPHGQQWGEARRLSATCKRSMALWKLSWRTRWYLNFENIIFNRWIRPRCKAEIFELWKYYLISLNITEVQGGEPPILELSEKVSRANTFRKVKLPFSDFCNILKQWHRWVRSWLKLWYWYL